MHVNRSKFTIKVDKKKKKESRKRFQLGDENFPLLIVSDCLIIQFSHFKSFSAVAITHRCEESSIGDTIKMKRSMSFFHMFVLIVSSVVVFLSRPAARESLSKKKTESKLLNWFFNSLRRLIRASQDHLRHHSTLSASSFWFLCTFNILLSHIFFFNTQLHKVFALNRLAFQAIVIHF